MKSEFNCNFGGAYLNNMSVLVVDDDAIARLIIEKNLRLLNYAGGVKGAANGEEALEIMNNDKPDAIFLDLNMPVKGGFDVLDEMKAVGLNIPVYVITSSILSADREKSAAYPLVKGFFEKPVTKSDVQVVLDVIK